MAHILLARLEEAETEVSGGARMITNEDKHQQAVTMILAATHKKRYAEALLEEAEKELEAGKKLLKEVAADGA